MLLAASSVVPILPRHLSQAEVWQTPSNSLLIEQVLMEGLLHAGALPLCASAADGDAGIWC